MYVVTFDPTKCAACGDCVDFCPESLLAMADENGKKYAFYKGNPEDCIGCLSCQEACAEGAVKVTEV